MTKFEEKRAIKSADRKLASPISDVSTITTIINNLISGNPLGCTDYTRSGDVHQKMRKSKEGYTGYVYFSNMEAKIIGKIPVKCASYTNLINILTRIRDDTTIQSNMGGSGSYDKSETEFNITVECHDPNGEIYSINFKNRIMSLMSYESDAIRSKVETWADGIPELQ